MTNEIVLTKNQLAAIDETEEWYPGPEQCYVLSGIAGSGKSTLVPYIIDRCDMLKVAYLGPTGKSANVLVSKGIPAVTFHSFLYMPIYKSSQKVSEINKLYNDLISVARKDYSLSSEEVAKLIKEFEKRKEEALKNLEPCDEAKKINSYYSKKIYAIKHMPRISEEEKARRIRLLDLEQEKELDRLKATVFFEKKPKNQFEDYDCIIVDEASMVTEKMTQDVLNLGIKVLGLGDKNQLGPVDPNNKKPRHKQNLLIHKVRFHLDESHRQGDGTGIIELSLDAKNGVPLVPKRYGTGAVVINSKIPPETYLKADAVLTYTHAEKESLNYTIRKLKYGRNGFLPNKGDLIICKKNYKKIMVIDNKIGQGIRLVNGLVCKILECDLSMGMFDLIPADIYDTYLKDPERYDISGFQNIPFDSRLLFNSCGKPKRDQDREYQDRKLALYDRYRHYGRSFEFAETMTIHSSQGSEYKNVIVDARGLLARKDMDSLTRKELLYTAITRARENVIVLIPGENGNFY